MSSWLDRVARRAAGQPARMPDAVGHPHPLDAPSGATPLGATADAEPRGTSRRDFLMRAGVVGAAVWTVPVIDSALAPAAAASTPNCTGVCGGACPLCGPGQGTCSTNSQCASGLTCSGGVCKAAQGSTCTANSQCVTNVCLAGTCMGTVAGTTCTGYSTCLSYLCVNGTCRQSGSLWPFNTCASSADCYTSGGCNASTHTCNDSARNGKCLTNADCASPYTCQGEDLNTWTYGTCK
jgi:hypothetical protein